MMVNRILTAAGYRAGLYLSPHIIDFGERVSLGTAAFSPEIWARTFAEVRAAVEDNTSERRPLTWFEVVTLFAFAAFRAADVDWGVFETGLGGRLDATNVLAPRLSVITNIELEHTEFLGNRVEEIAAEKGGIIKECTPVVLAAQTPEVRRVFQSIAKERSAPICFVDDKVRVSENTVTRRGQGVRLESALFRRPLRVTLGMHGECQGHNAALAALAVKTLFPDLEEDIIEAGLGEAKLPARFQVIERPAAYPHIPAVILDGAHTVESVSQGVATFSRLFEYGALLFACGKAKNASAIAPLFQRFTPITLTRPGEVPALDEASLCGAFDAARLPHTYDEDYHRAIRTALEQANRSASPLFVTGSFYLAGEVLSVLQ
jgi:dihydrofolate synthase/folylpolyglutamate synthase